MFICFGFLITTATRLFLKRSGIPLNHFSLQLLSRAVGVR